MAVVAEASEGEVRFLRTVRSFITFTVWLKIKLRAYGRRFLSKTAPAESSLSSRLGEPSKGTPA